VGPARRAWPPPRRSAWALVIYRCDQTRWLGLNLAGLQLARAVCVSSGIMRLPLVSQMMPPMAAVLPQRCVASSVLRVGGLGVGSRARVFLNVLVIGADHVDATQRSARMLAGVK